jgi:hypothetical protein
MDAETIGRTILYAGLALALVGAVVWGIGRIAPLGEWIGNLPGDWSYEGERIRVYVPLGTMIVVSIVLTILLNLILRIWR